MNDIGLASYWRNAGRAGFSGMAASLRCGRRRKTHHITYSKLKSSMAGKLNHGPQSRQTLSGQRVLRISGSALRIATWNVRSLVGDGRLENTIKELKRLRINIMGVSETKWTDSGKFNAQNGEFKIYHSGNDKHIRTNYRHGVAIIVNKEVERCVKGFIPISERVMMISIGSEYGVLNIIQVYAPTADKSEEEIESFYDGIRTVLATTKKHDVTIIMGDFNAKVGDMVVDGVVGHYGLGTRNDRGDRLVEFCQSEDLVITNTTFKLCKRRLYTWSAPGDGVNGNIIRNQIDYILINKRFRNAVKSVKTYPGADISSDHNPVVGVIRVKLKKITNNKSKRYLDMSKLNDKVIQNKVKNSVCHALQSILQENLNSADVNLKWKNIQSAIMTECEVELKPEKIKRKEWITDEILDLMEERRKYKCSNVTKYKETNAMIQKLIRRAKEEYNIEKCMEIERLDSLHDSFNMHKRIKEMTSNVNRRSVSTITEADGTMITDIKRKIKRWTEYVEELFYDNRPKQTNFDIDESNPILKAELEKALRNLKTKKAPGPDEVQSELLKLLDDDGLNLLLDLFNVIYQTGIIPEQWLTSTFITIPKKNNAKDCSDHRTIALMSHTLKLFLKIIHQRICLRLEKEISTSQFGFRQGMGTREALLAFNILVQRCMDINRNIFVCFIDFSKAFDNVKHQKLIDILKAKGIDKQDIRIISNLYWNQTARIKVDDVLSEEVKIKQGVRQGCLLSPLLFNIYSEAIFEEAILKANMGIKINGHFINNLRYADDTVVLAGTLNHLHVLMEKIAKKCNRYGLMMNVKKTKFMVITKDQSEEMKNKKLYIGNTEVERIQSYKYLGTWIESSGDTSKEIKCRVEIARAAFIKMRKSFSNRNLSLELRTRMVRCYIFSTLLYGMETWILKKSIIQKIQAFEMWCYRRILNISWTDRVTNLEVLRRMGKEQELLNLIKKRKLQYLGHILRGRKYEILRIILEGKICGKRRRGRRRMDWMKNLKDWTGCSTSQLFGVAGNRALLDLMISNLR